MATISELFNRDPLLNTKEDIVPIIEYYRARSYQFNLGNQQAGSSKKFDEPINLDDLNL